MDFLLTKSAIGGRAYYVTMGHFEHVSPPFREFSKESLTHCGYARRGTTAKAIHGDEKKNPQQQTPLMTCPNVKEESFGQCVSRQNVRALALSLFMFKKEFGDGCGDNFNRIALFIEESCPAFVVSCALFFPLMST